MVSHNAGWRGAGNMTIAVDDRSVAWFNEHVSPEPNSGCWLWTGGAFNGTYAAMPKKAGRMVAAHRFSYAAHTGPVGEFVVCHHCDTPLCVNPDHLFLGTQADNLADMTRKGRRARGGSHCQRGHDMALHGTTGADGRRRCHTCRLMAVRAYRARAR